MQSENNMAIKKMVPLRRYLIVLVTIVVGAVASVLLYMLVEEWEQEHQRLEFESRAQAYANAVQTSLDVNIEALRFLGAFFNNSKEVTRHEFSNYVNSVLPRFPGIHALSWNPLVFDRERADYEALAKKEGLAGFEFTERSVANKLVRAGTRQEYVVVFYIDPLETNRPALGFDIASNPTRRKAIAEGFKTGKLSATDRITLVQETGDQFGILILLPIYQQGAVLRTIEDRTKYRKGFVVEVLRIGDVVRTALKGFPDEGINLALYDLSAAKDKRVLCYLPSRLSGTVEQAPEGGSVENGFAWQKTIDFAGRQWKIMLSTSSSYLHARHFWQDWVAFAVSLVLTLVLAFYLYKKVRYTTEIERKVNQETRINQQLAEEISVRKQAQEKALRFGQILERSFNEIYVFNAESLKFIQVNEGARRNLGYAMEELQHLTPLDIKPEITHESFLERIAPLRTGAQETVVFNTVHRRKDGSTYPVEVNIQYITIESMPVFTAIVLDVTEKQNLAGQLMQAQKMEAIGTLAGGIAHDFNNILSAVIGYTEISLIEVETDTALQNNLKEILKAGNRARDLVEQILTFSRQTDQELKPVQVKLIVKEALKFLRSSLPTTIEVVQHLESESLIFADATQIHQVLLNLCGNAGHAMGDKGGVLEVKLADVNIGTDFIAQYPELKPGVYLELTVSDTGHGMPAHVLDRIFDPFFTTKEPGRGTGLGLSVVHGIVGRYGGTITVRSEPGEGTTFKVYFPIVAGQPEPQNQVEATIAVGNEHILLVDDEPALVNIGQQMLESLGYKVTTRTSSLEALSLFKAHPDRFDAVVTDMAMPHMSGDILSAELLRIRPDIPVILCTGYSSKISEETAIEIGIKAFAYKPITKHDLAQTVRRLLDETKAIGQSAEPGSGLHT